MDNKILVKYVYPIVLHIFTFVVLHRPSKEASLPVPAVAAPYVCGMLTEEKTMLAYVSFHIDVMEYGNSLSIYENIPLGCCLRQDVGHNR